MVDHYSDPTHFCLRRSTNQEEKLAGKSAFEKWAATFAVKIHRYHADNVIFADQPFEKSIE